MTKKIIQQNSLFQYEIVATNNVEKHLNNGYSLYGTPLSCQGKMYQAIVKEMPVSAVRSATLNKKHNSEDRLQQAIDLFSGKYPKILSKIAAYFQKRGMSLRQVVLSKTIDDLTKNSRTKEIDTYIFQLVNLLQDWMDNHY